MLLLPTTIEIQSIHSKEIEDKNIEIDILRLDTIHPIVSGNKLFKLYYFLTGNLNKTIITFGGAYSNHLVAVAFLCKEMNVKCIGMVRGEKPGIFSHTLRECQELGMQLIFVSRQEYKKDHSLLLKKININSDDCIIIPEGGYHPLGAKGASLITNYFSKKNYTHICVPLGTATTLAGLLLKTSNNQKVIGFSVLKGLADIKKRIEFLTQKNIKEECYTIINDYHFDGYAKKKDELLKFMDQFYETHQIPIDFVYTAKMMFGIFDLIKKEYFLKNSKVIVIHTGGLQGNLSLPQNTLTF